VVTLQDLPWWTFAVAAGWCSYQGFRGIIEQRLAHTGERGVAKDWRPWERWVVLYIHDFAFRFLCTAAGFVALYLVVSFKDNMWNGAGPSAPEAALLISLSLIALIGVGGQLHYAILLGKVPR